MSTKSSEIGKVVLHGIDTAEAGAHQAVSNGATVARHATRTGSQWASRQEANAERKTRLLKRKLDKQGTLLRKSVDHSIHDLQSKTRHAIAAGDHYVKRKPWTVLAIASVAAVLAGVLLGRRRA